MNVENTGNTEQGENSKLLLGDINPEKWKVILQAIDFFSIFDDSELNEMLELGEIRKFPIYDILIREGQVDYTFYVILRGKVNIVKQNIFRQKHNIASLTEGDCFGEVALLDDGIRSAFVITATGSYLYKINGKEIGKLKIKTQMKLFHQLAKSLANKLINLNVTVLSKNRKILKDDLTEELAKKLLAILGK